MNTLLLEILEGDLAHMQGEIEFAIEIPVLDSKAAWLGTLQQVVDDGSGDTLDTVLQCLALDLVAELSEHDGQFMRDLTIILIQPSTSKVLRYDLTVNLQPDDRPLRLTHLH